MVFERGTGLGLKHVKTCLRQKRVQKRKKQERKGRSSRNQPNLVEQKDEEFNTMKFEELNTMKSEGVNAMKFEEGTTVKLYDLDADNLLKHTCKSRSLKIPDMLKPLNDLGEKERCQKLLRRFARFT